jgi:hypothetical protein
MIVSEREIAELFDEASRLGRRGWPGAGFSRARFYDKNSERRKTDVKLKAVRIRFVPAPLPIAATACRCGGAWELRAGCRLPIHVGPRSLSCTPFGARAMLRKIAA